MRALPASLSADSSRLRTSTCLLGLIGLVCAIAACDDKPKDVAPTKDAAPVPLVAATASAAPKEPETTTISMDDTAVTVNGSKVPFEGQNPRARIVTELMGKPKIAGEVVPLVVLRAAKASKVSIVVGALKDALAKSIVVRAQKRDGQMAEAPVSLATPAPCSAVAMIGKDVAISVWTVGGTTARRFAKGMAGPDLTLGSEGFRKTIAACDSPVAVLAADDSVSWGLVYDLALTTKDVANDPKISALAFGLTIEVPVAGRKVTPL